jgi:hypothetical protein
MPNPAGTNQLKGREPAYGAVKQLGTLTREAPMSGAPVSSINAPKRAQRRAVKGSGSAQSPEEAMPAPPALQPSYRAQIAVLYQQVAQLTDDPQVHEYALLAQKQAMTG